MLALVKGKLNKIKSKNILFIFILFLNISCVENSSVKISSPNEIINFSLKIKNGKILYSVIQGKKSVISPSQLGIKFNNEVSLVNNFKLLSTTDKVFDETWEQPWGENNFVKNNYSESIISLESNDDFKNKIDIIVRVYDDGVAFRYNVKKIKDLDKVVIKDEITEFNISKNANSWWIKAYDSKRYEQLYQESLISEIDTVHTPLTMRFNDGTHISIHEAALINYSSMQIVGTGSKKLHCDLAPWSNGDKVRTVVPFKTPWRTIKITNNAKDLISSNITLNSNPPNKLGDVSWVKPSKYIGIWWGMIIGKWTWEESFRHGATIERSKKYIDFASANGFDEVLIEGTSAGFTGLFPGDTVTTSYTKTTSDFDLFEVQNYAKRKGVSLQAYHETSASTLNYMAQIEDAFSLMKEVGMQKAKIGHVGAMMDKVEYHYGQHAVNYYRKVLEIASKYNVAINFHEPIKDTGERRTYPNILTREGARGMEYNAWGNGGNPVDHTTILPFTRMLESPMDFTPGIFDLLYENLDIVSKDEIPVKITLIDKGNGYTNIRFKGGESFWQTKPMSMEYKVEDNDTTYIWSITEMMKPGQWDWGIAAHDVESDNNNVWLLGLLNLENRSINISKTGKVSGDVSLTIPDQDFNLKNKFKASDNDLNQVGSNVFGKTQRVNTTLAKQLAYYVVLYSPMQMASDFIENYKDQPGLQFIKDVPVDWEISKVLNAKIGEYVSIVRKDKNSSDWYLGAITNKVSRDFDFSLDFLDSNKEYVATIYKDGKNADWENNPKDLSIEKIKVKSISTLSLKLASGGGVAVRFNYIE